MAIAKGPCPLAVAVSNWKNFPDFSPAVHLRVAYVLLMVSQRRGIFSSFYALQHMQELLIDILETLRGSNYLGLFSMSELTGWNGHFVLLNS